MNAPLDPAVAPYVLSHTQDGVCRLTLNRGERYNPLSRAMIAALQGELARIGAEPSIRCVVLAAEGKGFCAGHDLKELQAHADLAWQQELFAACHALML
jgi:enoyl-CoA hydratase/carnithine racemase